MDKEKDNILHTLLVQLLYVTHMLGLYSKTITYLTSINIMSFFMFILINTRNIYISLFLFLTAIFAIMSIFLCECIQKKGYYIINDINYILQEYVDNNTYEPEQYDFESTL